MTTLNFYVGRALDRASHLRQDADWLAARIADSASRFIPVWRSKNLFASGDQAIPVLLPPTEECLDCAEPIVALLGLVGETAHFAVDISHMEESALARHGVFQDLRAVGPLLPRDEGALLAYARGIMTWHTRHLFCGRCGSPTTIREAGHVRICLNPDCAAPCFPRTDPAVIMLVHDGGDRVVLGRQSKWPAGQHSILAGFVEPGESLEDAVAREVYEEVGLRLAEVTYHSSQPWPFPANIMLGFSARAATEDICVNLAELEGARWFTRDDLRRSPENDSFRLPRRDSISRRIIEDWIAGR